MPTATVYQPFGLMHTALARHARCHGHAGSGQSQNTSKIAWYENTTPIPPIPTVSEWGLIVMTLLLLAAGTLVVGRRRSVSV